MTLFGSLKTSVTGLSAQSTKMGAISDNIANVSTVGYKRTEVQFATLVTERIGKTKFTPGGVTARPLQTVDVDGIIQASKRSTNIAIRDKGMFVVTEEDTFGVTRDKVRYTRSGAFRPNSEGYLRNAAGFYLQGYTTNRDGTPARDGVNFDSLDQNFTDLEPININRISNIAEETDNVKIKATLPAEASPQISLVDSDNNGGMVPGAGAPPNGLSTVDVLRGIAGAAKADYSSTVQVYDALGTPRNVTLQWYKLGDSTQTDGTLNADSTPNEWALHIDARTGMEGLQNATEALSLTVPADPGGILRLAGANVPLADATNPTNYASISAFVNAVNVLPAGAALAALPALPAGHGLVATDRGFNATTGHREVMVERRDGAGALQAVSILTFDPTQTAGTPANIAHGANVMAAEAAVPGVAFGAMTYTPPPDVEVGLVSFVGDFDESMYSSDTTDLDLIAAGGFATQTLFVKFDGGPNGGALRNVWTTLEAMRADVLDTDGNGIDNQAIGNRETDNSETPRQIGIAAYTADSARSVPAAGAAIDLLNPTDPANFATDFRLKKPDEAADTVQALQTRSPFDAQGAQPMFFELFIGRGTTLGDSLVGNMGTNDTFDGTGLDGINVTHSGRETPILETLSIQQDGIRAGTVADVEVNDDGMVTALYDNGMQRPIYQLALAKFTNYNGLVNESGNVYQESQESGDVLLVRPGLSGVGDIVGGALENANVDLGAEFTDMIITQQAFTANTRSITTTDEMLTDINNLIR